MSPPPPVIVLVRPQLGANIGKAARAMLNFGLTELRLVAPRDGWPPGCGPAARGRIRCWPRPPSTRRSPTRSPIALSVRLDCAPPRTRPPWSGRRDGADVHAQEGRSAILFGPERSGLETEDVALAGKIVTVPITQIWQPQPFPAVIPARLRMVARPASRAADEEGRRAPGAAIRVEGLVGQVDSALDAAGYYFPADRAKVTRLTIPHC